MNSNVVTYYKINEEHSNLDTPSLDRVLQLTDRDDTILGSR